MQSPNGASDAETSSNVLTWLVVGAVLEGAAGLATASVTLPPNPGGGEAVNVAVLGLAGIFGAIIGAMAATTIHRARRRSKHPPP